jgi:site-specific DNA-methyltransferase (adenine-specific)
MKRIPDKSIDMILCDLPYGTTACKWDTIIPFEPLWEAYKRIIKDTGAIVLTASQPFTSKLVMSNLEMFKYEWIWEKYSITGHLNAKIMPLKKHENVLVFYQKQPTYNPQMTKGAPYDVTYSTHSQNYGKQKDNIRTINSGTRYPVSIKKIKHDASKHHPTQKPVALFEYLIRTYTDKGDTVLDNCAGSFTTAVACIKSDRNYICIEQDVGYCEIGRKRIKQELSQGRLPLC